MPPGQASAPASAPGTARRPTQPTPAPAPEPKKKKFDFEKLKFWKRKKPPASPTPKKKRFDFERLKFWNRKERKRKEREAKEEEERKRKAAAEASRVRRQVEEEERQRKELEEKQRRDEAERQRREAEEQQRRRQEEEEEERRRAEEEAPIVMAPVGALDIPDPDGLHSSGDHGDQDGDDNPQAPLGIPLPEPPPPVAFGARLDPSAPPPAYPNAASVYKALHNDPLRKITAEEHAADAQRDPYPRFAVPTGDPNSPLAEFPTRSRPAPPARRALTLPDPAKVLPPTSYYASVGAGEAANNEYYPATQPLLTHIYTGLHSAHVGYVPAAPLNPLLFSPEPYAAAAGDDWAQPYIYGKPLMPLSPRPAYYHPEPPWISRSPRYDTAPLEF